MMWKFAAFERSGGNSRLQGWIATRCSRDGNIKRYEGKSALQH